MDTSTVPDKDVTIVEARDGGCLTEDGDFKSNIKEPHQNATEKTSDEQPQRRSLVHKDDPATMAASEELKHTTISDRPLAKTIVDSESAETYISPSATDIQEVSRVRQRTPEAKSNSEMTDKITSPKKKRGRDQEDDLQDTEGEEGNGGDSSPDGNNANNGRSVRSGPEKKRHRDRSEEPSKKVLETEITKYTEEPAIGSDEIIDKPKSTEEASKDTAQAKSPGLTSASAFKMSAFGTLAGSTTSPFGAIGANKPILFGASATSSMGDKPASGFGALAGNKPLSGFGSGLGTQKSGFGGAGPSLFGNGLSNGGFGSGQGDRLTTFAAPGKENLPVKSKPEKPFGAPESGDEASGSDDGDDAAGNAAGSVAEEAVKVATEEKKNKLPKVPIENGESGESTFFQVRAKLFVLHSKESGWKERGVGTLKLNVHKGCIDTYPNGEVIPGSFDPSLKDIGDAPSARLIMRQENTHKVILNTIIYKALEFKDKPSAPKGQIMFMALEAQDGSAEAKPTQMLLKMSEHNATVLRQKVDTIRHSLT